MDDFYKVCQEKLQSAPDPTVAIGELMALSLQDLPRLQLCKFSEQAVTLLSLHFQATTRPTQESQAKFRDMRQLLNRALDCMEQLQEASEKYPPPQQPPDDPWW